MTENIKSGINESVLEEHPDITTIFQGMELSLAGPSLLDLESMPWVMTPALLSISVRSKKYRNLTHKDTPSS